VSYMLTSLMGFMWWVDLWTPASGCGRWRREPAGTLWWVTSPWHQAWSYETTSLSLAMQIRLLRCGTLWLGNACKLSQVSWVIAYNNFSGMDCFTENCNIILYEFPFFFIPIELLPPVVSSV